MSESFLCQLDHLVGHPHGLFGFGWCLHPRGRVTSGALELSFADGSSRLVDVSIGRPREDVAAAFPAHPHAGNAGFMLLAGWPDTAPVTASLRFALVDGSCETVPLVLPDLAGPRRPAGVGWRYLARRTWAHLRRGRLRALVRRIRDQRRRAGAGVRAIDSEALAEALRGRRVALVVDHAMGGGANAYRERLVAELGADGAVVVVLTFSVSALALVAEVRAAGAPPRAVTLASLESLAAVLAHGRLATVAYNCAVSFPRPLEVRDLLLFLCRSRGARLLVAVHDYFTVCPSSFLLDDAGHYCGVPDLERCGRCLPAHADGFVSLAGVRSVAAWRDAWGELLAAADEIRCFSESSRRLLGRAYPGLGGRAVVRPHDVAPLRRVRLPAPEAGAPLVLGVIGSISTHKGAAVVADLAAAIAASGAAVRIVVVGHVDAACAPGVVQETGPYEPAQLPGLVERHGIGMALFPSICPETFSFVAHEILAMGLPLICLDLGAQADLARAHPRGRVSARTDGEGLLAEVLDFAATRAGAGHEVPA